jgi:hypothetical protein
MPLEKVQDNQKRFKSTLILQLLIFANKGVGGWGCAVSIPDGFIGFLTDSPKPYGRGMVLWSTQSLTEVRTRDISWDVKAADA